MRRIIIVGMAGPYEDKIKSGEELWGVNRIYQRQSNLNRLYFLDDLMAFDDEFVRDVDNIGIPIYVQKKYDSVKKSVKYPLDEIKAPYRYAYFTSTISYMIAHAIHEKVDAIHLHRILPFPVHGDYEDQKPCIEMWCGIAQGKGIEVTTSDDSAIMKPLSWQVEFYGYTDMSAFNNIKLLHKAGFRPDLKQVSIPIPMRWPQQHKV